MKNKLFSELTKNFSPDRRERIERVKDSLREEMALAELWQTLSFAQSTLAETLGVGQDEISKIENRIDIFVRTLKRFLEAMGGELEIRAVFQDRTITITNFRKTGKGFRVSVSGESHAGECGSEGWCRLSLYDGGKDWEQRGRSYCKCQCMNS